MRKKLLCLVSLLAIAQLSFAQMASKELAKSFNADGQAEIVLALPGEVNLVTWDKSHIQVVMKIEINNTSQNMLDELARVGRYDIKAESKGSTFLVTAPNQHKEVRIRGVVLVEKISFNVFVPANAGVKIENPKPAESVVLKE